MKVYRREVVNRCRYLWLEHRVGAMVQGRRTEGCGKVLNS